MRWLLALLVLLPILAFGQIPLEDISILPTAPVFTCKGCDPTDLDDREIIDILNKAAILNHKTCVDTNKNLFDEPAGPKSCWRGAAFIVGAHNNIGYYVVNVGRSEYNARTGLFQRIVFAVLLSYEWRPGDLTNCHQMIVCRDSPPDSIVKN